MYRRIALIIGAMLMGSHPAIAAQMTEGDLQMICDGTDVESKAACRFYILGVAEGIAEGVGLGPGDTHNPYCIAPNTSSMALADAVEAALRDDLSNFPKDRKIAAASFVGAVVFRAFPCQRQ
jgi:hypothetical protein